MSPIVFSTFGFEHNMYLLACLATWILFAYAGSNYLNKMQQTSITIFLAVFVVMLIIYLLMWFTVDRSLKGSLSLSLTP